MSRDLTKGSVVKNLMYMAVPTMFGFMVQSLYDLVDMIWIGRISSDAVAAVTIFSTIFWMVEILNEIIGTSSVSLISQSYGLGDKKKCEVSIEQTITFKAFVAIIAGVFLFLFIKPLIIFFSDSELVIKYALDYGYIRIFFLPLMFSSFSVNTALRCIGDSKKPMYIMTFSGILNIILDPIFMFEKVPLIGIRGFNMGVFGAALATVISSTLAFIFGFWILFSGKTFVKPSLKRLLKLNYGIDKKLLTIGLPNGFEMLFRNLAGFLTLKFLSMYGTTALAVMGVGNKLINFSFMPLVGLLMGGGAVVGQNIGANKIKRVEKTAHSCSAISGMIMSVVTFFGLFFPESLMKIFFKDSYSIEMGAVMIKYISPGLVVIAVFLGLSVVFSGSGYNLPLLISSLISRWGFQVPILYLIAIVWKLDIKYIWVTFLLAEAVEGVVLFYFYKKGKWKEKKVCNDD